MTVLSDEVAVLENNSSVEVNSAPSQHTPSNSSEPWTLYENSERLVFLAVLLLITISHYFDENIISVMLEPIKHEFDLSDTQLSLLTGSSFALVYALAGFPVALWADRGDRRIIITCAVAGWNVMTAVFGLANSFVRLAVARFGVGAMESGGISLAQSLITDYFPPGRRAIPTALVTYGAVGISWIVALGLGGAVAKAHGWRAVFLMGGIPGILLAVVARLTLREPRHRLGFPRTAGRSERVSVTFLNLRRKRSFLFLVSGLAVFSTFVYGVTLFVPSFLTRSFHATAEQQSMFWGSSIAIANILGAVSGGLIADRLSGDIRWFARLPAIGCLVMAPLYVLAYCASDFWTFLGFQFCADYIQSAGVPVILVAVSTISGSGRRAIATSLMLSVSVLVGGSLGPLFSGLLSDGLRASSGTESLRYSLAAMCVFLIPAAGLFYLGSRTMPLDREA